MEFFNNEHLLSNRKLNHLVEIFDVNDYDTQTIFQVLGLLGLHKSQM
jgi:hypothetical protein